MFKIMRKFLFVFKFFGLKIKLFTNILGKKLFHSMCQKYVRTTQKNWKTNKTKYSNIKFFSKHIRQSLQKNFSVQNKIGLLNK
ncbi:hypothetical protein BpHYR1_032439 [Brachionus plicatilis]|uniref:Uncharacterized protein n=1 Tax=Brachionus plicatilis TaxID=10195 RepID=A0A3M7PMT6_BRAPC|nr:hypothetical protein BpHYR1_032439 [Brachionus plicatilis]